MKRIMNRLMLPVLVLMVLLAQPRGASAQTPAPLPKKVIDACDQ